LLVVRWLNVPFRGELALASHGCLSTALSISAGMKAEETWQQIVRCGDTTSFTEKLLADCWKYVAGSFAEADRGRFSVLPNISFTLFQVILVEEREQPLHEWIRDLRSEEFVHANCS